MSEALEFEVRPIEGISVAVGEGVTFREEGDKLLALNEDGEAFGTVPGKFAAQLREMGPEGLQARVTARSDGMPLVRVEATEEPAAETMTASTTATAAEGEAGDGTPGVDIAEAAQAPEMATDAAATDTAAFDSETARAASNLQQEGTAGTAQPSETTTGSSQAPQRLGAITVNVDQSYEQFMASDATGIASAAEAPAAKTNESEKKNGNIAIAVVVVAAILVIIIFLAVFTMPKNQTVSSEGMSVEVPAEWSVEEEDEEVLIYANDYAGVVEMTGAAENEDGEMEMALGLLEWASGANDFGYDMGYEMSNQEELSIEDAVAWRYEMVIDEVEMEDYGTAKCQGYFEVIFSGDECMMVYAYCPSDEYEEHADELLEILDSVTLENPTAPSESLEDGGSSDEDA